MHVVRTESELLIEGYVVSYEAARLSCFGPLAFIDQPDEKNELLRANQPARSQTDRTTRRMTFSIRLLKGVSYISQVIVCRIVSMLAAVLSATTNIFSDHRDYVSIVPSIGRLGETTLPSRSSDQAGARLAQIIASTATAMSTSSAKIGHMRSFHIPSFIHTCVQ